MALFGTWVGASMPINMTIHFLPRLISCYTSLERVFGFFAEQPLVQQQPGAKALHVGAGRVELDGVEFCYPGHAHRPVLHSLSLVLEPGSSCGLVGASGCGKSTLAHLLMRFYDPTAGVICIDGQDLREVTLESVRRSIGLVQQEVQLWAGTIRDNLLFVNPQAEDAQLWEALDNAELGGFVRSLPEGLETVLGERGVRLSGGQRQRLGLARLFLSAPPLVVLDEATSALDGLAEKAVQRAMATLLQGRTALIIAHRLSTIIGCDTIVVMREGVLLDRGTHEQLLARCEYYHHLCAEQGLVAA
jgi:ATP-binding cassette subfamily B protein